MFPTPTLRSLGFIKDLFLGYSRFNSVAKDCKLVILVPGDLHMGKGKVAVSCSHASVLCYMEASKKAPIITNKWLMIGQKKVVLKWDRGLPELLDLAKSANKRNLISVVVRDAGMTQVVSGAVTAVGIGPGDSEEIDSFLPKLKLM